MNPFICVPSATKCVDQKYIYASGKAWKMTCMLDYFVFSRDVI